MNFDRYTERAQQVLQLAQETAIRMGHQQIDGEHVHYALATQEDGLIPRLINFMGGDPDLYAKDVEYELKKSPGRRFEQPIYTRRAGSARLCLKLRTRQKTSRMNMWASNIFTLRF